LRTGRTEPNTIVPDAVVHAMKAQQTKHETEAVQSG
jgi:hypothetical protein